MATTVQQQPQSQQPQSQQEAPPHGMSMEEWTEYQRIKEENRKMKEENAKYEPKKYPPPTNGIPFKLDPNGNIYYTGSIPGLLTGEAQLFSDVQEHIPYMSFKVNKNKNTGKKNVYMNFWNGSTDAPKFQLCPLDGNPLTAAFDASVGMNKKPNDAMTNNSNVKVPNSDQDPSSSQVGKNPSDQGGPEDANKPGLPIVLTEELRSFFLDLEDKVKTFACLHQAELWGDGRTNRQIHDSFTSIIHKSKPPVNGGTPFPDTFKVKITLTGEMATHIHKMRSFDQQTKKLKVGKRLKDDQVSINLFKRGVGIIPTVRPTIYLAGKQWGISLLCTFIIVFPKEESKGSHFVGNLEIEDDQEDEKQNCMGSPNPNYGEDGFHGGNSGGNMGYHSPQKQEEYCDDDGASKYISRDE